MANTYNADANIHSAPITADMAVKAGQGVYCGYTITATTAVGIIEIRDSLAAGGGVVIDVIPVGTTAGTTKARNVKVKKGIFVDFAASATGTLIIESL